MREKILVIVVTYNGSQWVEKCFQSLRESTIALSVVAIDNLSTDDTIKKIKAGFPEVELIESKENLGFGKANNIGLKKVIDEGFDYAFLLNQDAWVEKDTVEKLLEAHQQNPDYSILSPVPFFRENQLDLKFEKYYAPKEYLEQAHFKNKIKDVYQTHFINAAGWFLPNKTLKTSGFFDPLFSHYGEDVDYSRKINKMEGKIGIVSNALYFHDREQILLNDASIDKQIYYFLVDQKLFRRWSDHSQFRKEYISLFLTFKKVKYCLEKRRYDLIKRTLNGHISLLSKRRKLNNQKPVFL